MTDPSTGASTHQSDPSPGSGEQPSTAGQAKDAAANVAGHGKQAATEVAGHGKDAAADVAGHGKQAATDVADTAQDAVADVAGEVSERASDLVGRTRTEVREQVETQRVSAVATLKDLGDQLAALTDGVDTDGTVVDAAVAARDRVRGAADWLEERDPDEVLAQLRRVGRQRPGAFLLSAAVAGVVAGRLTRGAVAAHTDDGDDPSPSPRSSPSPSPQPKAQIISDQRRSAS